jgi:hypothetical protein
MRKIAIVTFAASLLAAAPPAQAANSNANSNANASRSDATVRAQSQSGGGARAREHQICVIEPRSETRLRRPICHSAQEWLNLEGEVPGSH